MSDRTATTTTAGWRVSERDRVINRQRDDEARRGELAKFARGVATSSAANATSDSMDDRRRLAADRQMAQELAMEGMTRTVRTRSRGDLARHL